MLEAFEKWFKRYGACDYERWPQRHGFKAGYLAGSPVHADDVQSPSLMYARRGYAERSYFYRQHKSCAQKFAPLSMDGFILDMIARNGD